MELTCSVCGRVGEDKFAYEVGPGRARVIGEDGWWLELMFGGNGAPVATCSGCMELISIRACMGLKPAPPEEKRKNRRDSA